MKDKQVSFTKTDVTGEKEVEGAEITVLVNDAEKSGDIDPQEAQQTLEIAEAALRKAEGKRQTIEANLALRRARTRVEAMAEKPVSGEARDTAVFRPRFN